VGPNFVMPVLYAPGGPKEQAHQGSPCPDSPTQALGDLPRQMMS
jgi:hypothetical protein